MWVFFAVFCGMVALLFLAVFLFNRWARKQPRHPANRAPLHDEGIPLHLMPHQPIIPVEPGHAATGDAFAAGGGDFGGAGADSGWSDSSSNSQNS
jgi:hypothetical protein